MLLTFVLLAIYLLASIFLLSYLSILFWLYGWVDHGRSDSEISKLG